VVRFVSAEPLLGPIDFTWLNGVNSLWPDWAGGPGGGTGAPHPLLDWVIVGGESGPRARPMHPAWARKIRDDCEYAEVPFFFKQWGEWGPAPWRVEREPGETDETYKARAEAVCATHSHTGNSYQQDGRTVWHLYEPSHKPWSLERTSLGPGSHEPIRRWGKKAAGRVLDGRAWNEFPRAGEPVPA
jgi:protein gp37